MNGYNNKFLAGVESFLKTYAVTCTSPENQNQWVLSVQDTVYVDFIPYHSGKAWKTSYNKVKFSASQNSPKYTKDQAIKGYYFPYIQEGLVTSAEKPLQFLKIPKVPEANGHKFAFTGGLCGCSILVLNSDTLGQYEVVHYPNSGGVKDGYKLLPKEKKDLDIAAKLDWKDYAVNDDEAHAFAFLQYDNGWKIWCQPLCVTFAKGGDWVYRINSQKKAFCIEVS